MVAEDGVRAAAAHIVQESRSVIADLLEVSGASAQFLDHPLQRAKRDVGLAFRDGLTSAAEIDTSADGSRTFTRWCRFREPNSF